ncbi:glutaredoxin domain-containing protein [Candidatus Mesenet endosymbiont of Agriotes lineatus]|uniref:glutaredoxin domain-containing protein n=1 Tax=Candidatus Mesenet endosymbiont of Agriotes lineatus TaxID=3077948 RepID=UPI0030D21B45
MAVVIYAKHGCPYCLRAEAILAEKRIEYVKCIVPNSDSYRKIIEKTHGVKDIKTVPQIFINDKHIGGCDKLCELDKSGELDIMLQNEARKSI